MDKIVAVVDSNIITLSTIKRVQKSLNARVNISPQIYESANYDAKDLVNILVRTYLIRSKLSEMGYIVSDDQVEAQIKSTEQRLGLGRDKLLEFLRSNGTSFDEYFELIRESIEFSIFYQRVISPLISITEQEVKNTFYRQTLSKKTLSFKYNLIDYSLGKDRFRGNMLKDFIPTLQKLREVKRLDSNFKGLDVNDIGDITEEGLAKNLKSLLQKTDEGSFAGPILIDGYYHAFFIRTKDLTESELYQKARDKIREQIFMKVSKEMISVWHQREENKHYVKYFL